MIITSPQNSRIKGLQGLRRRRQRKREGLMLVEGYEELALVLETGLRPRALFFCPELFRDSGQKKLLRQLDQDQTEIIQVSAAVFQKIAYRENPDGWLATCQTPERELPDLKLSADSLLVIAEGIEKPGNLGAILRTADAAGVEVVIACDPGTDWGNPNVVRASKGALFSVPVAAANTEETISWLRENGIQIAAATPEASTLYTQADLSGAVALVVGEEKSGLSDAWIDAADVAVGIPMFGRVNSLNVATSAALLIYEAVRQRG